MLIYYFKKACIFLFKILTLKHLKYYLLPLVFNIPTYILVCRIISRLHFLYICLAVYNFDSYIFKWYLVRLKLTLYLCSTSIGLTLYLCSVTLYLCSICSMTLKFLWKYDPRLISYVRFTSLFLLIISPELEIFGCQVDSCSA